MSKGAKSVFVGSISGFPELLPREQIAFNVCLEKIRHRFESYGFTPMETPVVEKASTLLSKGNDNEIYGLCRLASEEMAKKELGLRFDLTVPLARYVAEHQGQLIFPYKRYHIAPVFRGERAQAGRYRQFIQCDIDIIGEERLALSYDAEVLAIVYKIFTDLKLPNYQIRINNRKILIGWMQSLEISEESVGATIRQIDKKEKIDAQEMEKGLCALGISPQAITKILTALRMPEEEFLAHLKKEAKDPLLVEGLAELDQVLELAAAFGVDPSILLVDPTLARGLNYYTGTIYETKWLDCPELGSICGGGRYQNLAGTFTKKQLPGVGISIGVSRLVPKMLEKGLIPLDRETLAEVLVTVQDPECLVQYVMIAEEIRSAGIATEIYLQDKPLGNQVKYADRKGFKVVVIANREELEKGSIHYKILKEQQQISGNVADLIAYLKPD